MTGEQLLKTLMTLSALESTSKQRDALQVALDALNAAQDFGYNSHRQGLISLISEALAEPEPWTPDDMAYRPGGLPMDAPSQRKPLTDEQIDAEFDRECWVSVQFVDGTYGIALDRVTAKEFARAIERAHGIGVET